MNSPAAHTMISRADVLWRRVLDGVLVRVAGSLENTLIEGTGVVMWDLLEDPTRFDHLCRSLAMLHDADIDTVTADVAAGVSDLESRGVLAID